MPNLTAHFDIALEAAHRLVHSTVDRHMGSFLLGCVSPDIRIITQGRREETHFALLTGTTLGEGVQLMFQQYPRLAQAENLGDPTQAFIAGYISHLLADEAWIIQVYRPFFGNRQVFQDDREGTIMDRALQLELDRRARDQLDGLRQIRDRLAGAEEGVEIEFLPGEVLAQWREWVTQATQWEFSWDRLWRMAQRRYDKEDRDMIEIVEEFLKEVPQGLQRIHNRVPQERVAAFRESTIQKFLEIVGEYLP